MSRTARPSSAPALGTEKERDSEREARTSSGERLIELPRHVATQVTRVSDKFDVPEEALRSEPPPPPTAPPVSEVDAMAATTLMPVPESVKLLRIAVPTPGMSMEPVEIPLAAPVPSIEVEDEEEQQQQQQTEGEERTTHAPVSWAAPPVASGVASVAAAPALTQRSTRAKNAREVMNALLLFALLLLTTAVSARLIVAGFFQ